MIRGIGLTLSACVAVYISYSLYGVLLNPLEEGLSVGAMVGAGLSLVVLLGGSFYAFYMRVSSSNFFIEVDTETRKINWPDWFSVKNATGQVIVVMIFLMIFLAFIDVLLAKFREVIYQI